MSDHGTVARYRRGNCRCSACREAVWLQRVGRRERAAENGGVYPGHISHGGNGYTNYGCRCDTCRSAHRQSTERRRRARYAKTAANGGIAPVDNHNEHTYHNWGCRCDACRADSSAASLARLRARRRRARGGTS